jgi:hypothetical protein
VGNGWRRPMAEKRQSAQLPFLQGGGAGREGASEAAGCAAGSAAGAASYEERAEAQGNRDLPEGECASLAAPAAERRFSGAAPEAEMSAGRPAPSWAAAGA